MLTLYYKLGLVVVLGLEKRKSYVERAEFLRDTRLILVKTLLWHIQTYWIQRGFHYIVTGLLKQNLNTFRQEVDEEYERYRETYTYLYPDIYRVPGEHRVVIYPQAKDSVNCELIYDLSIEDMTKLIWRYPTKVMYPFPELGALVKLSKKED